MNPPLFIRKLENKPYIALNKTLYEKKLIEMAMKEEPDFIASVKTKGDYYLLELRNSDFADSFRFLDFMIYLRRTHGR